MPSFSQFFMESKGQPITYAGNILILADKFPVKNGDKLRISIEKTDSEYVQGLSVDITGSCEIGSKIWKKGKGVKMIFWEDSEVLDIKNIEITIFTKTGFVWIQNIWERENSYLISDETGKTVERKTKSTDSGHNGAAMIVEEIENGRRYRCNDGVPDDDFDDIVFTVQRVKEQST